MRCGYPRGNLRPREDRCWPQAAGWVLHGTSHLHPDLWVFQPWENERHRRQDQCAAVGHRHQHVPGMPIWVLQKHLLWLLFDFLTQKNDVKVPSKSILQKNFFFKLVFCHKCKYPDPLVRGMDPRIRIHIKIDMDPQNCLAGITKICSNIINTPTLLPKNSEGMKLFY